MKYIFFLFIIYLAIAGITFSVRHPWATDMEKFIYIKSVLTFEKISIEKMRENYK